MCVENVMGEEGGDGGSGEVEDEQRKKSERSRKGVVRTLVKLVMCGREPQRGRRGPSDAAPARFKHNEVLRDADMHFPLPGTVGANVPTVSRRAITTSSFRSCYVCMRDGVRLAVDIALPETAARGDAAVPVVFHQARYSRGMVLRRPFRWALWMLSYLKSIDPVAGGGKLGLLSAGYAIVSVDIRGTGASGGRLSKPWSDEERDDSIEILEWIVKQPFCDGNVCLWGISYDACAAFKTLSKGHSAIRAVAPLYIFWDLYQDICFPGGVPHHKFIDEWETINCALDTGNIGKIKWFFPIVIKGTAPARDDNDDNDIDSSNEMRRNQTAHAANWTPRDDLECIHYRDDMAPVANTVADDLSPYHAIKDICRPENQAVPLLFVSGFYDATCEAAISAFLATTSQGMDARLILGPWNHTGFQHVRLAEGQASRTSRFDVVRESVRFFNESIARHQRRHTNEGQNGSASTTEFSRHSPRAEDQDARGSSSDFSGDDAQEEERVFYYCNGHVTDRCHWKSAGKTWPPLNRKYVTLCLLRSGRLARLQSTATDGGVPRNNSENAKGHPHPSSSPPSTTATPTMRQRSNGNGNGADLGRGRRGHRKEDEDEMTVWSTKSFSGNSRWEAMTAVDSFLTYRIRSHKNDHLQYTTEPLCADLEMTGNVVVDLKCGSSLGVFDIFLYIIEVSPQGHRGYVTEGCFRSTHRRLLGDDASAAAATADGVSPLLSTYVPDEIRGAQHAFTRLEAAPDVKASDRVSLKFHLRTVSYCFQKGSRVQLVVAGVDTKHFRIPSEASSAGTWRVFVRLAGESTITLPIVASDAHALGGGDVDDVQPPDV